MGVFDNVKKKAEDLVGQDKVAKAEDMAAQHSDKVEEYSDKGFDAAVGKADSLTGGKHADKIQSARDAADAKVGNEGDIERGTGVGSAGEPGIESPRAPESTQP